MSCRRFENTLRDLRDCHEYMFDLTKDMSESEQAARLEMISEIQRIARELRNTPEDVILNGEEQE